MRCPKCGHDNPEGLLFCEECDWRTDQPVKMKLGVNSVYTSYISAMIGVVALVCALLHYGYVAIGCGVVGILLSGYSQTAVRVSGISGKVKTYLVIIAGIGIVTSMIGFIWGLYSLL